MSTVRPFSRLAALFCAALLVVAPTSCDAIDRGDLNGDGVIDGNDIPGFMDTILDPDGASPDDRDQSDIGSPDGTCVPDASVDVHDIPGMVLLLMGDECNFAPVILNGNGPIELEASSCQTCSGAAHNYTLRGLDPNGDTPALQWSITTPAESGTASIRGTTTGAEIAVCYEPAASDAFDSFTVTVSDGDGGSDSIVVNVTVRPEPQVTIQETQLANGVRLDAGAGFTSYVWSPGGELTRTIDISTPGVYSVSVTDADGCTAQTSKLVTVAAPATLYRINAGGPNYTDPSGNLWSADTGFYNLGMTSSIGAGVEIAGTDLDVLYRTDRWDSPQSPEMMYSFPVANGDYRVRLHFAETFWTVPARRIMDIAIEGVVVLEDYDIVATVGPLTADVEEFDATVTDGQLNIQFLHNFENPKICAIEIIRPGDGVAPPTVAITSPMVNQVIDGDEVNVSWQAAGDLTDADHVHLRLDTGTVVMIDELNGSYTFTGVAPGAHTLTINLVNASHQNLPNPESTNSVNFSTQVVQTVPPAVTMTSPADGATLTGTSIAVSWQTGGDLADVDHAHLQLDSSAPVTLHNFNGTHTFTGVAPGAHTISIKLADSNHQPLTNPEATDTISVTLNAPGGGNDIALFRLNCGGPAYTDPDGKNWSPDAGFYNTGGTFSTTAPIANTLADTLYQTERFNSSSTNPLVYSLPVDPGTYRVRLHFAEIWSGAQNPGVRIFDVLIENQLVLDNFDISGAGGYNSAVIREFDTAVSDGMVNITFLKGNENPKVSAIEVIQLGAGEITVSPNSVEWGHVGVGVPGFTQTLTIANPGSEPATINAVAFLINNGVGHDFRLTLNGTNYVGDHDDIAFPTSVTIPAGSSINASVAFLPTEASDNDVWLEFRGTFATQRVRLRGIGGEATGHPFLHVVIVAPPVTVDFDQNGSEPVLLQGHDSHTHELGHDLARYEWRENGTLLATTVDATVNFAVGTHPVTLTIFDDNVPPEQLSATQTIKVVGPNAVPGALVRYYPAAPGGATALLDAVPATASFGEVINTLDLAANSGRIGTSPYSADVMVRINTKIALSQSGGYEFVCTGGAATRLFVNGSAASGAVSLSAGTHAIEARFAVNALSNLPLQITLRRNGAAATPIAADAISHDQSTLAPIINTAPTSGSEAGGNLIRLTGLGFVPLNQVVVRWGSTNISGASLAVTPTAIEFTSPPGTGTIPVSVQTPNGTSNSVSFSYTPGGPTPIVFTLADIATITKPTAMTFGPDGRLYVATVQGKIAAYTLDDNGNVTATQNINTLNTVSNNAILGIAVNPFDPPSPVRLYVAHGFIFANGGACFEGVSPYSGQISVLTGPNFNVAQPLVTGLPVSNHDHSVNGLEFDNAGNLLIAIGGNTNAGIPHCNIGQLPESPLTAAIVKAELWRPDFKGVVQYADLATGAISTDQVFGDLVNIVPGNDLYVFGHGIRNPYDLIYTTANRIYATDNGPNPGFGVASTSATTQGTTDPNQPDELLLVEEDHYYGHPNRNRGRCDDRQNVYYSLSPASVPGTFTQALATLAPSTDGILEYRSETFNGQMRGDLVVQKWNGPTTRIKLAADGRSVVSSEQLNVVVDSLDIVLGPGGTIFGANYSDNKVSIARPSAASGLQAFDILPWRAPASGGTPFIIAGNGFGTLSNTSVTIGGIPATLTSVSATRIRGTTPVNANPSNSLVNVAVTVGGASKTIANAFRYLPATSQGNGTSAYLEIDPGGNILGSSTYNGNSFKITNNATGGQKIARVTYDFSGAIFRDIVFDPTGNAGDTAFKPFQVNTDPGVGVAGHEFRCPHDGGFDRLVIRFNSFAPSQTFGFSVDADPTSINGAAPPGPSDSGSISGLELAGTWVTVVFDDGTSYRRQLFPKPGSETGAHVDARPTALPRPVLSAVGIASTPANVTNASQTIRVAGPAGASVRLVVVDGALYTAGLPGGGFDLDPFEANTARVATQYTATVAAGGTVDIPVTLTKFDVNAGINHIVAAFTDAQGRTSDLSNVLILDLN